MAKGRLLSRAWTLYLLMAVLAILLGVAMFLLAGGWKSYPVLPYSQLTPAAGAALPLPHA